MTRKLAAEVAVFQEAGINKNQTYTVYLHALTLQCVVEEITVSVKTKKKVGVTSFGAKFVEKNTKSHPNKLTHDD